MSKQNIDVDAELALIKAKHKAQQAKSDSAKNNGKVPPQLLPPPSDPMAVARKFVEYCCLHNGAAGELKLRCWHGGWWAWRTTHWVEVEEREVRALFYAFTEHAHYVMTALGSSHLGCRRARRSAICLRP